MYMYSAGGKKCLEDGGGHLGSHQLRRELLLLLEAFTLISHVSRLGHYRLGRHGNF